MTTDVPLVNSHDGWSRLEEVWLGDVYPASWYDHLESPERDALYHLTELTKQDLSGIENKLMEFGITVRRPRYDRIEDYLRAVPGQQYADERQLVKPDITPRDSYGVVGNILFVPEWPVTVRAWQYLLDEYSTRGAVIDRQGKGRWFDIVGGNVLRIGRDIFIDTYYLEKKRGGTRPQQLQQFMDVYAAKLSDYRVHFVDQGYHIDGYMACLRPGLFLCNQHHAEYDTTLPGWTCIERFQPKFQTPEIKYRPADLPKDNRKWWLPDASARDRFGRSVLDHAVTWAAHYVDTYFEVNCLVLDENNVLFMGDNPPLFEELAKHGITAHPVPFRARAFWDGAPHCLTVDIRRQGQLRDYFSNRGRAPPVFH